MSTTIWTIGHSTHSIEEFIAILHAYDIEMLVDVRSLPGSKKFPQFNKENLEISLAQEGITYHHLPLLGGRRKGTKDSKNKAWHNISFRAYADYIETNDFKVGILNLKYFAQQKRVAIMCSEVLWWHCHRSLIADVLKSEGWTVIHIRDAKKSVEHPYTAPAKIIDGKLIYLA